MIREWLAETHGAGFELLRHFLRRFFDSERITARGEGSPALIGGFSVAVSWFPMLAQTLMQKYRHFAAMPVPEPFRQALRGDELWLLTLMMSFVGLLTAIKWQALFPGLRDYRTLGSLPLTTGQIFFAKLAALLLMATAVILTLNAFPGIFFPMVSGGRWGFAPSLGARIRVYAVVSCAACYFFFFALVALQGVLLNLLRPRSFAHAGGAIQGLLVAAMLSLMVLSFSVEPRTPDALLRAGAGPWLPPLWFVGLYQTLSGDPSPAMHVLARRASSGLLIATAIALLSYLVSYGRHRQLLVEGVARPAVDRKWTGAVLEFLLPDSRQQAVVVFMLKTLGRSSHHRMILMGYSGFGLAVVTTAILTQRGAGDPVRLAAACFIYTHVILLIFLLIGLRHLFSIPAELAANWIFQIAERDGRSQWLRAVDRFVLWAGALILVVLPFPLEVRLLGWRAVAECVMFIALGLLTYDWLFSNWEKLPFTCSQLPGKTPVWVMTLYLIGLLTALPAIAGLLFQCLFHPVAWAVFFVMIVALRIRLRQAREEFWGELRLKYDELPDPAVHELHLHFG